MEKIEKMPIEINPEAVLIEMGYSAKDLRSPSEEIKESVEEDRKETIELLNEVKEEICPRGIKDDFEAEIKGGQLILWQSGKEKARFNSSFLVNHIREGKVSLFIVTIGEELEQKAKEYKKKGDKWKERILDALGSEAAEQTANYVHRLIEKERGMKLVRYSPGYGEAKGQDWSIQDQKIIFSLLRPREIDITLTKSCMMLPRKSISAIIGVKTKG